LMNKIFSLSTMINMLSPKNSTKDSGQSTPAISLADFPPEITSMIFKFLDLESLCRVGLVCKRWYEIANDSHVWTDRIERKYGHIDVSKIRDKKRWFLYKLCVEPYHKLLHNMDIKSRLDFRFEERLFYQQISYNTWGVALRLLHGPLQNNITIFSIILQTLMIFAKLEGLFPYAWFLVFTPLWFFDMFYASCTIVWFYFMAHGLIEEEFAEKNLSGWLKSVLNALRTRWLDNLLFVLVSCSIFLFSPFLLVLQLDVFHWFFVQSDQDDGTRNDATHFRPFKLPWTAVFAPLIFGITIILLSIRRRIRYNRRRGRYYRLPTGYMLLTGFLCVFVLFVLIPLQLDEWLPSFWNCWLTAIPVWVLDVATVCFISGVYHFDERMGRWAPHFNLSPQFSADASLLVLLFVFQCSLCHRMERIWRAVTIDKTNSTAQNVFNESYILCFAYLFAVEGFAVLTWLQDIVDFGGYQRYSPAKRFVFSIKRALQTEHKRSPSTSPRHYLRANVEHFD
jgi:hypothetical protein